MEFGAEISFCMYVCMYLSDFVHELQVKMFAGQCRTTADSKSTSHRFDAGK